MPRRSDEDDIQLPSDPDYITPPTDRRKCGAERVSFSGEGSISVPSPVKQIKFEKQGRAQEQSALCSAHVTGIGYRPALRYPTSNSIPSTVKRMQAPQSEVIEPSFLMMRRASCPVVRTMLHRRLTGASGGLCALH